MNRAQKKKILFLRLLGFLGCLLTFSFFFLPSNIGATKEWGTAQFDLYGYMIFIIPLGITSILALVAKRYFGFAVSGIVGILLMLMAVVQFIIDKDVNKIDVEIGYYSVLIGMVIITISGLLLMRTEEKRKRNILPFIGLNLLMVFLFIASAFFTAWVRGSDTAVYLSMCLFSTLLVTVPIASSIIMQFKRVEFGDIHLSFGLNLITWGIYLFILSLLFFSGGVCSCEGCVSIFPIGHLSLAYSSLLIGISYVLVWYADREKIVMQCNDQ